MRKAKNLFPDNPKLSFCITCKNRISQIKKTLPLNLSHNRQDCHIVEFILVDFGSKDGLQDWITAHFIDELNTGYLKYYHTEELPDWHASIAKNTAYFYANNDILVNLDCDNYTGCKGGHFVIQQFIERKDTGIVLHQFNRYGDGSFGRISMMKHFFDKIGGYDESFEPKGYQDDDLIYRLRLLGLKYVRQRDERYNKAEPNTKIESISNTNSDLSWQQMLEINMEKSRKSARDGMICTNKGCYGLRTGVCPFLSNKLMKKVTVILTVWKRNHLEEQIEALLSQSQQPAAIWVQQTENHVDVDYVIKRYSDQIQYFHYKENKGVYGRFESVRDVETEYVFIMDDDIIPGIRFLEVALRISVELNAIISSNGRILDPETNLIDAYIGNGNRFEHSFCTSDTLVDFGNNAWLFKTEWIEHFLQYPPLYRNNGEDIHLSASNILAEIVVTPNERPFRTATSGGIIANVSATILSTVGTANDVLQRMPGILVDNNEIAVFGKGAPVIYINNRLVRDKQELEQLESSEISIIELITNPGAKYDAEGRAVLLIKTKNKMNGFSAQITERIRKGYYLGDNENISISYVKDKLNVFTSYNHQYAKKKADEYHHYMINSDNLWIHDISMPDYVYSNDSHQLSVGIDYSLNDNHAVGGEYQYYMSKGKDSTQINSSTLLNNSLYDEIFSNTLMNQKPNRHLFNAFYSGKLSDKYSLRLDIDYMKNHDFTNQISYEISDMETRTVNTLSQTDYKLIAGKITNSYHSVFGLIEFGGEYNDISGDGFTMNPEGYIDNNIFTNFEQKTAGFINYSHNVCGINISAGLRYENALVKFTEDSTKKVIVDKRYNDIYPNVSFSKQVKNIDLNLSINKRTQRPTFRQLNGNTYYVNRFSYQKGNPYLTKSDFYDVNFRSIYKQFYLNFGYVNVKNPIISEFKKQGSNAFLSTYANYP